MSMVYLHVRFATEYVLWRKLRQKMHSKILLVKLPLCVVGLCMISLDQRLLGIGGPLVENHLTDRHFS
jgi:hypothetical protein